MPPLLRCTFLRSEEIQLPAGKYLCWQNNQGGNVWLSESADLAGCIQFVAL